MRVVLTCGPSYEPIDEVRRITNFSTGQLGISLANACTEAGHQVTCFKGVAATSSLTLASATLIPFSTNQDLEEKLRALPTPETVDAFFHLAALCDYRVASITDSAGSSLSGAKIPSRAGELTLHLVPAKKLLGQLRGIFPRARIIGWKYELEGNLAQAQEKAEAQIAENGSDACVLNGRAYGAGFALLVPGRPPIHFPTPSALADGLLLYLIPPA